MNQAKPRIKGVAPCANPDCGALTRSSRHTLRDYPGTILRIAFGLCKPCYQAKRVQEPGMICRYPVLPCPNCGALTRSTGDTLATAPGTRKRVNGMCFECDKKKSAVTAQSTSDTARALASYLAARRAREEAARRRNTIATTRRTA